MKVSDIEKDTLIDSRKSILNLIEKRRFEIAQYTCFLEDVDSLLGELE